MQTSDVVVHGGADLVDAKHAVELLNGNPLPVNHKLLLDHGDLGDRTYTFNKNNNLIQTIERLAKETKCMHSTIAHRPKHEGRKTGKSETAPSATYLEPCTRVPISVP